MGAQALETTSRHLCARDHSGLRAAPGRLGEAADLHSVLGSTLGTRRRKSARWRSTRCRPSNQRRWRRCRSRVCSIALEVLGGGSILTGPVLGAIGVFVIEPRVRQRRQTSRPRRRRAELFRLHAWRGGRNWRRIGHDARGRAGLMLLQSGFLRSRSSASAPALPFAIRRQLLPHLPNQDTRDLNR